MNALQIGRVVWVIAGARYQVVSIVQMSSSSREEAQQKRSHQLRTITSLGQMLSLLLMLLASPAAYSLLN